MIAFLEGAVVDKQPTTMTLLVGGVGYELHTPTRSSESLPGQGETAFVYTHLHVREDAHTLFGFATATEKALFRLLLGTSGIGPKLALAMLSAMSPSDLQDAVDRGDLSAITRIPGVGRKTAERLLVELRDRIGKIDTGHDAAGGQSTTAMYREEAVAALEALGIGKTAAEKLIRTASEGDTAPVDTAALVRRALREL